MELLADNMELFADNVELFADNLELLALVSRISGTLSMAHFTSFYKYITYRFKLNDLTNASQYIPTKLKNHVSQNRQLYN